MRFSYLFLIGLLLPLQVYASASPDIPQNLISPYAKKVAESAMQTVQSKINGDTTQGCDADSLQREIIKSARLSVLDVQRRTMQPSEDLARSACYLSDLRALERYGAALFTKALEDAKSCKTTDAYAYKTAFGLLWANIHSMRLQGLDPSARHPLMYDPPTEPPEDPDPDADDALCPYTSDYAHATLGEGGCRQNLVFIPPDSPTQIADEAEMVGNVERYIATTSGMPGWILNVFDSINSITKNTYKFVKSISSSHRPLASPRYSFSGTYVPLDLENKGESGCIDWWSDTTGSETVVTGENMPLLNYRGTTVTRDLERVVHFIFSNYFIQELDYTRSSREEREKEEGGVPSHPMGDSQYEQLMKEHNVMLRRWAVAVTDPQKHMQNVAQPFHLQSRRFARLVAPVGMSMNWMPPLRQFIINYATFLSRMCPLRGCRETLLRTIELSAKQECFGAYLMDVFFDPATQRSTLPQCQVEFAR